METISVQSGVYNGDCPTRQALDRIADKWTTLIIGLLEEGPKRFSELQRGIGGRKQLTAQGLVLRRCGLGQYEQQAN